MQQDTVVNGKQNRGQETVHEGNPKSCEHEYGSYCLWSTEHREVMKDAIVKRLKDQLFIARAHYPSIAKIKQHERFTRELKQSIQEHERMLSDTITDADLPTVLVSSYILNLIRSLFFNKIFRPHCCGNSFTWLGFLFQFF